MCSLLREMLPQMIISAFQTPSIEAAYPLRLVWTGNFLQVQRFQTAVLHLRIPIRRQRFTTVTVPRLELIASGSMASNWSVVRSFRYHDRQTWPAIRICAQSQNPGCIYSALELNHRNYLQCQPEHVEDEFMHHKGGRVVVGWEGGGVVKSYWLN